MYIIHVGIHACRMKSAVLTSDYVACSAARLAVDRLIGLQRYEVPALICESIHGRRDNIADIIVDD